jgi:hypothetical protein
VARTDREQPAFFGCASNPQSKRREKESGDVLNHAGTPHNDGDWHSWWIHGLDLAVFVGTLALTLRSSGGRKDLAVHLPTVQSVVLRHRSRTLLIGGQTRTPRRWRTEFGSATVRHIPRSMIHPQPPSNHRPASRCQGCDKLGV